MNDFNQIFNLQSWQEIIQLNLTPWRLFIAIVDISLITFLIYSALRSVQGTKLMTLVRGVLLFIMLKIISGWLGLGTFEWLLNQVITYGLCVKRSWIMNPLAWWMDYCVGAVETSVSRLELWSLLLLKSQIETANRADQASS